MRILKPGRTAFLVQTTAVFGVNRRFPDKLETPETP
jgi:hypothetical protein